jgi:hypothetical protein
MTDQSYTTTIAVDATPAEAYAAIIAVRDWWSHDLEGSTDTVGALFTFRSGDIHRSQIRVTELVPGELVAWEVLETHLSYVEDQTEWPGTRIVFEISGTSEGTRIRFSHVGLVPADECYEVCSNAWAFFVGESLRALVETGAGQPLGRRPAA